MPINDSVLCALVLGRVDHACPLEGRGDEMAAICPFFFEHSNAEGTRTVFVTRKCGRSLCVCLFRVAVLHMIWC